MEKETYVEQDSSSEDEISRHIRLLISSATSESDPAHVTKLKDKPIHDEGSSVCGKKAHKVVQISKIDGRSVFPVSKIAEEDLSLKFDGSADCHVRYSKFVAKAGFIKKHPTMVEELFDVEDSLSLDELSQRMKILSSSAICKTESSQDTKLKKEKPKKDDKSYVCDREATKVVKSSAESISSSVLLDVSENEKDYSLYKFKEIPDYEVRNSKFAVETCFNKKNPTMSEEELDVEDSLSADEISKHIRILISSVTIESNPVTSESDNTELKNESKDDDVSSVCSREAHKVAQSSRIDDRSAFLVSKHGKEASSFNFDRSAECDVRYSKFITEADFIKEHPTMVKESFDKEDSLSEDELSRCLKILISSAICETESTLDKLKENSKKDVKSSICDRKEDKVAKSQAKNVRSIALPDISENENDYSFYKFKGTADPAVGNPKFIAESGEREENKDPFHSESIDEETYDRKPTSVFMKDFEDKKMDEYSSIFIKNEIESSPAHPYKSPDQNAINKKNIRFFEETLKGMSDIELSHDEQNRNNKSFEQAFDTEVVNIDGERVLEPQIINIKNRFKDLYCVLHDLKQDWDQMKPFPSGVEEVDSQITEIKDFVCKIIRTKCGCEESEFNFKTHHADICDSKTFRNHFKVLNEEFFSLGKQANSRYLNLLAWRRQLQQFSEFSHGQLQWEVFQDNYFSHIPADDEIITTYQEVSPKSTPSLCEAPRPIAKNIHGDFAYDCPSKCYKDVVKKWKERNNRKKLVEEQKAARAVHRKKAKKFGQELAKWAKNGKTDFHLWDVVVSSNTPV